MTCKGVIRNNVVILEEGVQLPDGLRVTVIPEEEIFSNVAAEDEWLKICDEVREAIRARVGGYAGDSVQELRELREERADR
jgi:hypothetical protein